MKSKSLKKSGRYGFTAIQKTKGPQGFVSSSLRGLAAALISVFVLVIISAVALYATDDPTRFVFPVALAVLYLSLLFGGWFAARLNHGSALLCGSLVALLYMGLLFVGSLVLPSSLSADFTSGAALGFRGIGFLLCLIGAFMGAGERKRKNKKTKYYKSH